MMLHKSPITLTDLPSINCYVPVGFVFILQVSEECGACIQASFARFIRLLTDMVHGTVPVTQTFPGVMAEIPNDSELTAGQPADNVQPFFDPSE